MTVHAKIWINKVNWKYNYSDFEKISYKTAFPNLFTNEI